jgi:hypothetical protein
VILISSKVWKRRINLVFRLDGAIPLIPLSIIEVSGLKEVKLIGRKFTWANNLPDPTLAKTRQSSSFYRVGPGLSFGSGHWQEQRDF